MHRGRSRNRQGNEPHDPVEESTSLQHAFAAPVVFALTASFIFYATAVPFDFSRPLTFSDFSWIPFWDGERGRIHSIPDLIQNVVLFMPFGFFGFLALERVRARGLIMGSLVMAGIGLALSMLVELIQTMSAVRLSSASDLAANAIGSGAGAAGGAFYALTAEKRIREGIVRAVRSQPGMVIVLALFLMLTLVMLAPLVPTLDVGMIRAQVRRLLLNPLGMKPFGGLVSDALLFAGFAFVTAYEVPTWMATRKWLPFRMKSVPGIVSAPAGGVIASGLAIVMEIAQLPLIHHSPGAVEALVNVVGSCAGAGLAFVVSRGTLGPARSLGELSRNRTTLVLMFGVLTPTLRALDPFQFTALGAALGDVNWTQFLPFWQLFRHLTMSTFINVFEAASMYLTFGYALRAIGYKARVCLAWAVVLAEVLEFLQIPVVGRTFDVTEGLLAAIGAVTGAVAYDRLRNIEARA